MAYSAKGEDVTGVEYTVDQRGGWEVKLERDKYFINIRS